MAVMGEFDVCALMCAYGHVTVALLPDVQPLTALQQYPIVTSECSCHLVNYIHNHLEVLCRLSTNMVIYLTRIMGCRPAFAATQVNLFEGTCYLTPVLGAWLADAHWGRYKTILVFSGIYFVVRSYCEQF